MGATAGPYASPGPTSGPYAGAPDPAAAFYAAVREHNDKVRLLAREGRCGGCIGAGKARNCAICAGLR
jgi:hypothetical protein